MKKNHVTEASDVQLVGVYRDASARHGEATQVGDHETANEMADLIAAIYAELRRRGLAAQNQLLSLLGDVRPGVRLWAAAHALEFAPQGGEEVLEALVSEKSLLGFSAEMTLREWRAGRLRFP